MRQYLRSPGRPFGRHVPQGALALFHDGLEKVIPLAEQLQVKILVEPEPDLLLENTASTRSSFRETASNYLGLNFDIGHFFCAGEDSERPFKSCCPGRNCHIEDIAHDRRHYHLIPGLGAIDFITSSMSSLKPDIRVISAWNSIPMPTCPWMPVRRAWSNSLHLSRSWIRPDDYNRGATEETGEWRLKNLRPLIHKTLEKPDERDDLFRFRKVPSRIRPICSQALHRHSQ